METGLAGKRVLVTGASGGIGAACARAFAAEGSRVGVHFHQGRERAEAVAADCEGSVLLQADLRYEDEADRLFAEAREELGGLDVCAAVAGVWPEEDVPLWELSLDRWQESLAANLTANPFASVTTVTTQIVQLLTGDQEFDSPKTLAAFALGLVLFLITLALNLVALHVVRKYREAYE